MMKIDPECVIVGPDHYNTLNILRALGKANIQFILILVAKSKRTMVECSKFCKAVFKISDYSKITETLLHLNLKKRVPIITINDRAAFAIDSAYNELISSFILPNVKHKEGGIIRCMDKKLMSQIAQEVGLTVPATFVLPCGVNTNELDILPLPCIVKPVKSVSGSKNDMAILRDKQELIYHLHSLSDKYDSCLIQEYIDEQSLLLIAGVRTEQGHIIMPGTINKIKRGKHNHNLGLNAYGLLTKEVPYKSEIENLLNRIDYHGLFSFEFISKCDNPFNCSDLYFIEMNLRSDGLLFFYTAAGMNLPEIWIKSCLQESFSGKLSIVDTYGINESVYIKEYVSLKSLYSTIKDIISANCFSVFSKKDIKPFIRKYLHC